jgi:hypothetical protein
LQAEIGGRIGHDNMIRRRWEQAGIAGPTEEVSVATKEERPQGVVVADPDTVARHDQWRTTQAPPHFPRRIIAKSQAQHAGSRPIDERTGVADAVRRHVHEDARFSAPRRSEHENVAICDGRNRQLVTIELLAQDWITQDALVSHACRPRHFVLHLVN